MKLTIYNGRRKVYSVVTNNITTAWQMIADQGYYHQEDYQNEAVRVQREVGPSYAPDPNHEYTRYTVR